MRMETIHVTREDIMDGVQENCHRCPVARAIHRHFEPHWTTDVDVSDEEILVEGVGTWATPQIVRDFIGEFDTDRSARHWIPPFTFHLWRLPNYA